MVKQIKLHFWSSTEDFLTEKGQNCLSQWSFIEGSIFICACTISISSRYSREITQRQRQNTLLRTEIYTSGSITEQMATGEEKVIFNIHPHQSKTKEVSLKAKVL